MDGNTPRTDENTPPSSHTPFDRARETVRSLREDIVIFQDPSVRNYLETIPTATPIEPTSPSQPPEQLHAIIIALRTRLDQTVQTLNRTKAANLDTRKRAARAEGEVAELRHALEQRQNLHDATVTEASTRIEAIEHSRLESRAQLQRDALLIRQNAQFDRIQSKNLEAERDAANVELASVKESIAALRRDLNAAEKRHQAEKARLEATAGLQTERVNLLESELEAYRLGSDEIARLESGEAASARALADRFQRESIQLKSDLQWRNTQAARLQERLDEAEKEALRANSKLNDASEQIENVTTLEKEVTALRAAVRDKENTSGDVAALLREKNELARLISSLSPSGNVQEGLHALREAANGKPLSQRRSTGTVRKPLGIRHEETIAELRKSRDEEVGRLTEEVGAWKRRAKDAEDRLSVISQEKEAVVNTSKRNDRMRRLLKKENEHLRAALDEFEKEDEVAPDRTTDFSVPRLKKQLEGNKQIIAEYKATVKDLEATTKSLTQELQSFKEKERSFDGSLMTGEPASTGSDLQQRLIEATKAASLAIDAKTVAEVEATRINSEMRSLRAELENLRLQRTYSALNTSSEPLDYDPSSTKVLHMQDNPLQRAAEKEANAKEKSVGKKRLRAETGIKSSPPRSESTNIEIAQLEEKIAHLEELNLKFERESKVGLRTKEIALKRIEEVRSAVYNIFGWSMKVIGARYVVSSIYAEGPREEIEFGLNESGTMSLLENEYTARLRQEIEQYVQRMNSFPALLAHITMENFENTTAAL